MRTVGAIARLIMLCCAVHFLAMPLVAAGAATGLLGRLVGRPDLTVAGGILALAVITVVGRMRPSRSTDGCGLHRPLGVRQANGAR